MRRAFKKKKFTWIPILPTVLNESIDKRDQVTWFDQTTNVEIQEAGTAFQAAINIVPDHLDEYDPTAPEGQSLRDLVEGQDYVIERIVGKVWAALEQKEPNAGGTWYRAIVGMGLAVMPYDSDDTLSLSPLEIDPLCQVSSGNPWMWRRTTTLYNNLGGNGILGPTNIQNDGPEYGMVDVRSVRRVRREERLTLVTSMHWIDTLEGEPSDSIQFDWGYDFRVLGAMRKAHNRSDFK